LFNYRYTTVGTEILSIDETAASVVTLTVTCAMAGFIVAGVVRMSRLLVLGGNVLGDNVESSDGAKLRDISALDSLGGDHLLRLDRRSDGTEDVVEGPGGYLEIKGLFGSNDIFFLHDEEIGDAIQIRIHILDVLHSVASVSGESSLVGKDLLAGVLKPGGVTGMAESVTVLLGSREVLRSRLADRLAIVLDGVEVVTGDTVDEHDRIVVTLAASQDLTDLDGGGTGSALVGGGNSQILLRNRTDTVLGRFREIDRSAGGDIAVNSRENRLFDDGLRATPRKRWTSPQVCKRRIQLLTQ